MAAGRSLGSIACLVSAVAWFVADVGAGRPYSQFFIPYWNSLIRLSFFVIITMLLVALKTALEHEKELSNTDFLTGASNSRHFYHAVEQELRRIKRTHRPFTVVYIDVDNFKAINGAYGHTEGDLVLQKMISAIKSTIRKTDLVARLGGDEFALFFPETDQLSARVIIGKISRSLAAEMKNHETPVTFSIGVLTCAVSPAGIDELIAAADTLMYRAKHSGKDAVNYALY
ncbi:MAG: GGDEF domain-containing protein [Caldilineaceae bacterium]